ncbi:MAG: endonuclease [Bdellovibrionales bacterium]|nr:endonuclease [Bdellovibrionales bacterium]
MRTLMFLLCAWFAGNAFAAPLAPMKYYPADFYQQVDAGLDGQRLKDVLFRILSSGHISGGEHDALTPDCEHNNTTCRRHFSLGYTAARKVLFGQIHLHESANSFSIFDVYCETTTTDRDIPGQPPGPGQIPDAKVLNAEHTWPQSHFTKKFPRDLQKSDLHILYPVLARANSSRGNLEFNEVVTPTTTPCAKSRRGYASDGSRQQFFEPPASHKGNVARALFYFSVRYQVHISAAEESSLRTWNHQDPPDEFERRRNDQIDHEQNNRNPFIDYPELADLIADF